MKVRAVDAHPHAAYGDERADAVPMISPPATPTKVHVHAETGHKEDGRTNALRVAAGAFRRRRASR